MRVQIESQRTRANYWVDIPTSKQTKIQCPECLALGNKSHDRALSINYAEGVGKCHRCETNFFPYKEPTKEKKEYKIPEWKNQTNLTDEFATWFKNRGIMGKTLNDAGICSAMEYMPQTQLSTSVICFPYYRNGKLTNVKYRDINKNFKLVSGAELIFYNEDVIRSNKEIVIVEGEIDALSFMQVGINNVISVPNGAGVKNLEYLESCYNDLMEIEKFYIATDCDAKGRELKDELARRLGTDKCYSIDFKDCKDANEYLVKYGGYELSQVIKTATEFPIYGIINVNEVSDSLYDLYINGLPPENSINVECIDKLITWETGRLAVVTGIPGHGKTEVVKFITTRLNMIYGWKAAYCSPESYPPQLFYSSFMTTISGKSFNPLYLKQLEYEKTKSYVYENFFLIYPDGDMGLDTILNRAELLVKKKGIKVLVLDPYNKLDHKKERGESETEYISRFLDTIHRFAQRNNCLVILVAHPYKMKKTDAGVYEMPTLYDISGSAHFFNKTDYGLVVYRNYSENLVKIFVQKVKFKHLGPGGDAIMEFDVTNDRYFMNGEQHDYSSYLGKDWTESASMINTFPNSDPSIDYLFEEPPF